MFILQFSCEFSVVYILNCHLIEDIPQLLWLLVGIRCLRYGAVFRTSHHPNVFFSIGANFL